MSNSNKAYASIDEYMSKYRQGYNGYAAAAAYVQDACHSALSSSGILANVSSRAKNAERLNTKLLNMHKEQRFDKVKDIEDRIVDIIGVRVLVYFPSQVEEVIAKFESLFPDAILDRKELNDTKSTEGNSMTAPVVLEKLGKDDTMKKLGSGPVTVTDTDKTYTHQNRYGGYRAVHIRFTMPTLDLGTEMRSMFTGRLKVEVQIQTLLMHSWSEVSHDLIYKELSGKPSVQEYQLLDCLNGVGKLGENVILQLRSTMDVRLKKGSSDFKSSFILAQYIRQNLQEGFGTPPPVMGDVDDFLNFLNLAQQNDPKKLLAAIDKAKEWIKKNPPPTGTSQISSVDIILSQMVEDITFTPETPFLLKAQNDQLSKATDNNKNEILATIFDLTCRPILQSVPEKILATNLQFPLAFRKLQELELYNDNKPAMPRTAFPVHRTKLGVSQKAINDLVIYFQKRLNNAIVLQYLRHAQIRAWKQFEGRDFSKDFV